MKTQNLRINQLSPKTYHFYLDYLASLDNKDLEQYSTYLSSDVVLQINNQPMISGKMGVVKYLEQYWRTFESVEHELLNIYGNDEAFVLEAMNDYKRNDGKMVQVRAVAFTDLDERGKVRSVRLYSDVSPVFEKGEQWVEEESSMDGEMIVDLAL